MKIQTILNIHTKPMEAITSLHCWNVGVPIRVSCPSMGVHCPYKRQLLAGRCITVLCNTRTLAPPCLAGFSAMEWWDECGGGMGKR